MTRGGGGVKNQDFYDDILFEWPLMVMISYCILSFLIRSALLLSLHVNRSFVTFHLQTAPHPYQTNDKSFTFDIYQEVDHHLRTYRKIPNVSPGLIEVFKHFLGGLYSGGLIFGGGVYSEGILY